MIKEAILDLLKEQNPDLYYRIYLEDIDTELKCEWRLSDCEDDGNTLSYVSGYIWGETIYVRRDI